MDFFEAGKEAIIRLGFAFFVCLLGFFWLILPFSEPLSSFLGICLGHPCPLYNALEAGTAATIPICLQSRLWTWFEVSRQRAEGTQVRTHVQTKSACGESVPQVGSLVSFESACMGGEGGILNDSFYGEELENQVSTEQTWEKTENPVRSTLQSSFLLKTSVYFQNKVRQARAEPSSLIPARVQGCLWKEQGASVGDFFPLLGHTPLSSLSPQGRWGGCGAQTPEPLSFSEKRKITHYWKKSF